MPDVSLVITTLTVAAALSLVVERVLEVIKHFRDSGNAKIEQGQVSKVGMFSVEQAKILIKDLKTTLDAYQKAKKLNALRGVKSPSTPATTPASFESQETATDERIDSEFERHDSVTIVPTATIPLGEAQTSLVLALFATGIGIFLAELFNLTLLSLFLTSTVPHWVDITLSGIVIGGGSQPIHVLLRFLTTRKVSIGEEPQVSAPQSKEAAAQTASTGAVNTIPSPTAPMVAQPDDSYWQPIVYKGGVNPESLEQAHLRDGEPDLIVYHHTAMSSSVPFQGIVDEFLVNKKWLTGYHCVIMPDGAIKPFCRWDRYGNHAKGLNQRSLGIAFHGNFHTLANDRFSNHDGRFGFQKPTTAQLDAGARIVALWVHLYPNIQLDFEMDILPHKTAMPGHTVCPGSNFPHDEFQRKVTFYYEKWEQSQTAQQHIAQFKQNAYIYATV